MNLFQLPVDAQLQIAKENQARLIAEATAPTHSPSLWGKVKGFVKVLSEAVGIRPGLEH